MTSEIFFLFSRCNAAATVNHPPPPHSGETWDIGHKAKPNNDNALHTGDIFLSLIPTKMRIIPHIKETKKHLVQTHSFTVFNLCLQLFQQEINDHSPSGTFFISIPTHAKWYHLTLQCKLSHPIMFSSQFGPPHGQRMSSAESSSDSIKCIGISQGTKMY